MMRCRIRPRRTRGVRLMAKTLRRPTKEMMLAVNAAIAGNKKKVNELVYWSTEFILSSCDLEVSADATVMMAPAHGSLPTSAEPQMASHCSEKIIPLPRGWTKRVKSALIQSVSLAATALTLAHGRASSSRVPRKRMAAELDRATTEIVLLKEELDIKDDRWSRLPSRRRPY